jgi:hypothetical protein
VSSDDLQLIGVQLPALKPGLFFMGSLASNNGAGEVFGDGLLCASGVLQRLEVQLSDANGDVRSTQLIASNLGAQIGATNYMQLW